MRATTDKINWGREIAIFLLISFMITSVLFAFFYGLFLIAEYRVGDDYTARQVLEIKWFFSLYFAVLLSLEAWALGLYDIIEKHLERKNVLKALGLDSKGTESEPR